MRWQELGAFAGVVYRSHEGIHRNANTQPWSTDATLAHFARFARVFRAFRPYRRQLMAEAAERGWPVVRHPVLHYPDDPVLLADRDVDLPLLGSAAAHAAALRDTHVREFMLGADWLVAPVLAPGVATVRVYFPRGVWASLWDETGDVVDAREGGVWREVAAPIGRPAVFSRAGAGSAVGVRGALREAGLL